jgi:hypothetical protein
MSEHYFSVEYRFPINVAPLPADYSLPEEAQLEQEMPLPFRIAAQEGSVDLNSARHLRAIDEELQVLVTALNQQSRKINLLLGYLLSQLDDPAERAMALRFGASTLCFESPLPLAEGTLLRLKLFLQEESAAIYCYGVVTGCHGAETEGASNLIEADYVRLRNDDKEALIRASLNIQSRQLKLRAEQKANTAPSKN